MGFIKVPRYVADDGRTLTICWTGKGDNPDNIPRCKGGGGGGGAAGDNPATKPRSILVSDAAKLQGMQEWTTETKLIVDSTQGPLELILEPANIKEIFIEENIFKPFLQGYMTIDTWKENVEREPEDPITDVFIQFRNDGRDELDLVFEPNITPENPNPIDLPPEQWSFKNKFIIYDKEDIGNQADYKIKKLYFWDKNYQLMRERKIQWSTGIGTRFITDRPKEPIAHQPDSVRSMPTGEALASLLWDAGFGEYIDFDYWDWGATNINYALRADQTVMDGIEYIISQHISKEFYDQCLFIRDRYTRKYRLVPFWKIFEYAGDDPDQPGPWQREHLFLEQDGDFEYDDLSGEATDKGIISPWKAPLLNQVSYDIDIKTNQWGFITNYNFTDMSGIDSSLAMVSKPVHTHNQKKGQFTMEFENHEIEKVRDDFILPYRVDFVLGDYPIYTLNKTKKQQIAIDYEYIHNGSITEEGAISRFKCGKNKITFANLFLNEALNLTMYGSTHRQAGMFIGVDRYNWSDNDFDYKLCGQWYATTVTHQMLHNKYVNKISMVKLHAYKEYERAPEEDVI